MKTALVLGAGIQGCTVALMLKKYGYSVKIVDQSTDIFNRTSLNQEGKVHLGFVYGLDSTLNTGKKLLSDALHFSPYLEYLLEKKILWDRLKSTNFNYLVAKDSLLSPDDVESYFQKLQNIYEDFTSNENLTYLGKRPDVIFQKTLLPPETNHKVFDACFQTNEVAIDTEILKEIIKEKIMSQRIPLYLNHRIANIKRTTNGFSVKTFSDGNIKELESDLVFNCLWEERVIFDKQMGIIPENDNNYRLKFGIILKSTENSRMHKSFTILQGPYGDYVNFPNSDKIYFSWYSSSMIEMVVDKEIPSKWSALCNKVMPYELRQTLINENLGALYNLVPTLHSCEILSVVGGIIVANGNKDIHDPSSGLHKRFVNPITSMDGYFSINTGKFTSAPHNTLMLETLLGHEQFESV